MGGELVNRVERPQSVEKQINLEAKYGEFLEVNRRYQQRCIVLIAGRKWINKLCFALVVVPSHIIAMPEIGQRRQMRRNCPTLKPFCLSGGYFRY
jgi:hypothetical protein